MQFKEFLAEADPRRQHALGDARLYTASSMNKRQEAQPGLPTNGGKGFTKVENVDLVVDAAATRLRRVREALERDEAPPELVDDI